MNMEQYSGIIATIVVQTIAYGVAINRMLTGFKIKISEIDTRLMQVEREDERISKKLENIENMLMEIRLELKDKANRNA